MKFNLEKANNNEPVETLTKIPVKLIHFNSIQITGYYIIGMLTINSIEEFYHFNEHGSCFESNEYDIRMKPFASIGNLYTLNGHCYLLCCYGLYSRAEGSKINVALMNIKTGVCFTKAYYCSSPKFITKEEWQGISQGNNFVEIENNLDWR